MTELVYIKISTEDDIRRVRGFLIENGYYLSELLNHYQKLFKWKDDPSIIIVPQDKWTGIINYTTRILSNHVYKEITFGELKNCMFVKRNIKKHILIT